MPEIEPKEMQKKVLPLVGTMSKQQNYQQEKISLSSSPEVVLEKLSEFEELMFLILINTNLELLEIPVIACYMCNMLTLQNALLYSLHHNLIK